jgi:hypothetical protein
MQRYLMFFTALLLAMPAYSEEFPAPFGLTWKMSEKELRSHGFSDASNTGGLKIMQSFSAPKAWSKAEKYYAVTYEGELVKAIAVSKSFTDDVYGSEGKELYNQMKAILTEKYGTPTNSFEVVGNSLYDEPDEFYQCLDYSGCGNYLSIHEFNGGTIGIRLEGERRGQGYLQVGYESPYFSAAKADISSANTESDTEAF